MIIVPVNEEINLKFKTMSKRSLFYLILIPLIGIFLLFQSCGQKKKKAAGISVSIEPLKFFVEELTAGEINVNVMVPVGASPATYSPSTTQLTGLSSSRLYIKAGHLGFEEAWMQRFSELNPEMKILDLSEDVHMIEGDEHRHGESIRKGGVDPHIWMSPKVVMGFLPKLREKLIERFPEHKQTIVQSYPVLYDKVKSLHAAFSDLGAHLKKKEFMIFHPALSYLARDYGFEQIPIEYEGKEPSPQKLRNLIDLANKADIKVIFIQMEFDRKSAGMVTRETGAKLITINPLAYDWPGELMRIHDLLKEYLD